jgi:hypothetical protein
MRSTGVLLYEYVVVVCAGASYRYWYQQSAGVVPVQRTWKTSHRAPPSSRRKNQSCCSDWRAPSVVYAQSVQMKVIRWLVVGFMMYESRSPRAGHASRTSSSQWEFTHEYPVPDPPKCLPSRPPRCKDRALEQKIVLRVCERSAATQRRDGDKRGRRLPVR